MKKRENSVVLNLLIFWLFIITLFLISGSTDVWKRSGYVSIFHPETNKYLAPSGKEFGRPISGQMEIVASKSNSKWKAMEGVFVKPTMGDDEDAGHDEL